MANSRTWMMYNMHQNNNNEFTKSQTRLAMFLRQFFDHVIMERWINDLHEVDYIIPTTPPPRADIFIHNFSGSQPLIIRVMGGIHEGKTQKMKDEDQRVVLEGNGYLVVDIWWDDFDELWNGTDEEAYEALVEYFNGDREVLRY